MMLPLPSPSPSKNPILLCFVRMQLQNKHLWDLLDYMIVLFLIFWEAWMFCFPSGCNYLHSRQQCTKVPFSPYLHQHFSLVFLVMAFLTAVTEKAMAIHSSTLAWKIPWMEEPGRLKSMGSWRVGHNRVTSLSLFTFIHWRRKWQPTPVFLPGESQGQGSLVGCRLWGRTESDTTEAT